MHDRILKKEEREEGKEGKIRLENCVEAEFNRFIALFVSRFTKYPIVNRDLLFSARILSSFRCREEARTRFENVVARKSRAKSTRRDEVLHDHPYIFVRSENLFQFDFHSKFRHGHLRISSL